jgi:hypothetical protein
VHIEHGMNVLQFDRTERWVRDELVNRIEPLDQGPHWRAERTGLHQREFIDTVRHWFTGPVPLSTGGMERGGVRVMNLVEGADALISSPDHAFTPFTVHYAETVVIPAAVGAYTVAPGPAASAAGGECAIITASVRHQA